MNVILLVFLLTALILTALLVWAVRPPKRRALSPNEVFEALSQERHCSRLPQIMQSLQPNDAEFLRERGHPELLRRLCMRRKRIALRYLDVLQADFEVLLEASRILVVMSPGVIAMQEAERFKLNLQFALRCRYLRWKLHLGLSPWHGFEQLGEMASGIALRLETATAQLGERASLADEFSSLFEEDRGDSPF